MRRDCRPPFSILHENHTASPATESERSELWFPLGQLKEGHFMRHSFTVCALCQSMLFHFQETWPLDFILYPDPQSLEYSGETRAFLCVTQAAMCFAHHINACQKHSAVHACCRGQVEVTSEIYLLHTHHYMYVLDVCTYTRYIAKVLSFLRTIFCF